jgi:hypothetical protein
MMKTLKQLPRQYFVVSGLFVLIGVINLVTDLLIHFWIFHFVNHCLQIIVGLGLLARIRAIWTMALALTAATIIAGIIILTRLIVILNDEKHTPNQIILVLSFGVLALMFGIWQYRILIRKDVCEWYEEE